jgi:hypothetical protein
MRITWKRHAPAAKAARKTESRRGCCQNRRPARPGPLLVCDPARNRYCPGRRAARLLRPAKESCGLNSLILRKWPRRLSQAGLLRMPRGRPNGVRDGKPTLNEAARAADAARDTIWQGNCDLADLRLRNNIAPIRNTIPIQYPISNCPAKKRLPSSRCIESAPGRGSAIPQLCAVGALPIQH